MENLEMKSLFNNVYRNKKILITGNTGFKGAWLTIWLLSLNAKVYGISKGVPTKPSIFESLNLINYIKYYQVDINHFAQLKAAIFEIEPDFVFHLAAQPLVSKSYQEPIDTFMTNVIGTANLLEVLRLYNKPCVTIMVTSDKCYENYEWKWGYRESDRLGGNDPYSASKGACEIVIHSFYNSFFKSDSSNIRIASVRAGNVIGGGDWAENRLIPDAIRAWIKNQPLELRNPNSIRPWQHVLESLSGYLRTGQLLYENSKFNGESFNFGPNINQSLTVSEILDIFSNYWVIPDKIQRYSINSLNSFHEAGILKLNCDKAFVDLQWLPVLEVQATAKITAQWYYSFYFEKRDMYSFTLEQIKDYEKVASAKGLKWTF